MMAVVALQTDPLAVEQLGRIATAQIVMMICTLGFAVVAIVGAFMSYSTMKTMSRTLAALEKVIGELAPRAEPLIDGLTRVAVDSSAMTETARRKMGDILDTADDLNVRIRKAADAAEKRVRDFGAVLDVVQAESEELLLDAASTAHGIHAAAERLRGEREARRLPPRTASNEQEVV